MGGWGENVDTDASVSILGVQVSGITEKTGLTGKDEISLGPTEFEVSMGHS